VWLPFLLYFIWRKYDKAGFTFWQMMLHLVKASIPMIITAGLYLWYNWLRFGDVLQFGHDYLPEFTEDPNNGQFGFQYIKGHFGEWFKTKLDFRNIGEQLGMWFKTGESKNLLGALERWYILNPVFIFFGIYAILRFIREKWMTLIAIFCMVLHFFVLMCHKTLGGWGWGERYTNDVMVFVFCAFMILVGAKKKRKKGRKIRYIGNFAEITPTRARLVMKEKTTFVEFIKSNWLQILMTIWCLAIIPINLYGTIGVYGQ
jgi:hypothetical protein